MWISCVVVKLTFNNVYELEKTHIDSLRKSVLRERSNSKWRFNLTHIWLNLIRILRWFLRKCNHFVSLIITEKKRSLAANHNKNLHLHVKLLIHLVFLEPHFLLLCVCMCVSAHIHFFLRLILLNQLGHVVSLDEPLRFLHSTQSTVPLFCIE